MSGYPPPPPPYDPYNARAQRRNWKAQQRAYVQQQKAQQRWQKEQLKAYRRGTRRRSLVGPILLVALGITCLAAQFGSLQWSELINWYSRWWPAVMIAAGLTLLIEWAVARQSGEPASPPKLGGGILCLLILLASIGFSLRWVNLPAVGDWNHYLAGTGWERMMGESHDFDDSLNQSITPQQVLVIRNPRGDVKITGSSQDNQIHLDLHKQVYAWQNSEAETKSSRLTPRIDSNRTQLVFNLDQVDGGTADLTFEVPHATAVRVESSRGDVTVSEVRGDVDITANQGAVDLNGITGSVNLHTNYDDANISGHSITGEVSLQGHAGDLTFSDIDGGLSMQGDFFGSTHIEHVNGIVRFETSRTQLQMARLEGELNLDGGADMNATGLLGPVTVTTRNRNITLERVEGRIAIKNRNGAVNITNSAPLGGIEITNEKGSVDVGIPSHASFSVHATTHRGDIENDFGLKSSGDEGSQQLHGTISGGGAAISITTSDGDITLRKSTVAPLAPTAPPPPPLRLTPPKPPTPPASKH